MRGGSSIEKEIHVISLSLLARSLSLSHYSIDKESISSVEIN